MALSRVQGTAKAKTGGSLTVPIPFSTPPTVGNAIIVCVNKWGAFEQPLSCTDTFGNTYTLAVLRTNIAGVNQATIFYCPQLVASGASFTVTVTAAGGGPYWVASAIEVGGLSGGALAIDQTVSASAAGAAVATGATAALTASEIVVAAVHAVSQDQSSITVETVSPAWTQEFEELPYTHIAGEADSRILTAATGTTASCAWTNSSSGNYSTVLAAFKVVGGTPPETPAEEVRTTQAVLEVAAQQDGAARVTHAVLEVLWPSPPAPDACLGGGTMPAGVNPPFGPTLSTAQVPLAWLEVTIGDTVHRWAAGTIPHGPIKRGRVLRFGTLTRRLTDGDGGPQAATVTTILIDTDRVLRTTAFAGTLQHALVEYFIADLDTVRLGALPWRVFRGRVQSWSADATLTLTLTVEDELTARLTSANAIDLTSPRRLIDETVHDDNPLEALFQQPAPEAYGALSDEVPADPSAALGTWQVEHVATLPGLELAAMFLVCAQPVSRIQSVFVGDSTEDPPVHRVRVPEAAYGDWLFVPGKPGWPLVNPWYETTSGRWTVFFGRISHPSIAMAIDGRIPITVNFCAYEDVGDSTGLVIDSPPRACLHWFNNRLLEDATGDWLPLFGLGDYSLFDTNAWEAVHGICAARGYTVSGILGHDFTAMSWRDRVAEWCRNFDFDLGTNRHGQVILAMLDRTQAFADARRFTPQQILERGCTVRLRADAVENIVSFAYARNYLEALQEPTPDPGAVGWREPFDPEWRSGLYFLEDEASIAALGGRPRGERRSELQGYSLVRDPWVAFDVALQRLARNGPPNGRAEVTFDLWLKDGWPLELGDIITLEHWDLPWTVARRCQVRGLELDLDALTVRVTVREVDDLLPRPVVPPAQLTPARLNIMRLGASRLAYLGGTRDAAGPRLVQYARRRFGIRHGRHGLG